MTYIDNLYMKIDQAIRSRSTRRTPDRDRYNKNEEYRSYGLYTSQLRETIRSFRDKFKQLTLDGRLALVESLYKAGVGEHADIANYILHQCNEATIREVPQ